MRQYDRPSELSRKTEVQVHLDFKDFDDDAGLICLLTDYRLASDHTVARLSYVYRPKADAPSPPRSEADYEFKIYGGGDESRSIRPDLRRRICLDVLGAPPAPSLRRRRTY